MSLLLNKDSTEFLLKDITSLISLLAYTADKDYMLALRVDLGKPGKLLNSAICDITVRVRITRDDAEVVEVYSKTFNKLAGQTTISHNLDKSVYVKDGEAVQVYVSSTNVNDTSISGDVYVLGIRSSGGTSIQAYTRDNIRDWLKIEFQPLLLATPDETIDQVIQNAIRYWNTYSGYKISRPYTFTGGSRIQLDTDFKSVVQVYPAQTTGWVLESHPMWSLLGLTVLDNISTDIILMSEAFKNYQQYIGSNFQWTWEKSEDPDNAGGYLYVANIPAGNSRLFVVGTKRITSTETDITSEYILDWVLDYSKALLRMIEGNTLRKADIVNIKNDGQEMVNEGRDDKKDLQERLYRDGRWVVLARRA